MLNKGYLSLVLSHLFDRFQGEEALDLRVLFIYMICKLKYPFALAIVSTSFFFNTLNERNVYVIYHISSTVVRRIGSNFNRK